MRKAISYQLSALSLLFFFSPLGSWLLPFGFCQQPQAQSGQPIYAVNAKYTNGVAPGYWPTAGSGLTLNLSAGTAWCGTPPASVNYAGGTLTMTASSTNYVYLDQTNSCAPGSNTTGFLLGQVPLAQVVTGASTITSVTDLRTHFIPAPSFQRGTSSSRSSPANSDANLWFPKAYDTYSGTYSDSSFNPIFGNGTSGITANRVYHDATGTAGQLLLSNLFWSVFNQTSGASPTNAVAFYPFATAKGVEYAWASNPILFSAPAHTGNSIVEEIDLVKTNSDGFVEGDFVNNAASPFDAGIQLAALQACNQIGTPRLSAGDTTYSPNCTGLTFRPGTVALNIIGGLPGSGKPGWHNGIAIDGIATTGKAVRLTYSGSGGSSWALNTGTVGFYADPNTADILFKGKGQRWAVHDWAGLTFAYPTVSTTSSTSIAVAGQTSTITPAAMTNIYPGIWLTIDSGGANAEDCRVTATTSTTFTCYTAKTHTTTPYNIVQAIATSYVGLWPNNATFAFANPNGNSAGGFYAGTDNNFYLQVPNLIFFRPAGGGTTLQVDGGGATATGYVTASKYIKAGLNSVAFSATPTFDASLGNTQTITLTGNVTSSTLSNCAAGEWLTFDIIEDATGGRTFVAPTTMKGFGTINTAASKHNVQMFYCDGTNAWAASPMQSN